MIRAALLLLCFTGPVAAGGLMDRDVTFGSLAYDELDRPIYVGQRHAARVTDAVEYGLGPEGVQNGWDIVPAIIDIQNQQIVLSYPREVGGVFPEAAFNGYVLDFLTQCVLFEGAEQDLDMSSVALKDGSVFVEGSKLYIDVAGITYGPETIVVVNVSVADCPLG